MQRLHSAAALHLDEFGTAETWPRFCVICLKQAPTPLTFESNAWQPKRLWPWWWMSCSLGNSKTQVDDRSSVVAWSKLFAATGCECFRALLFAGTVRLRALWIRRAFSVDRLLDVIDFLTLLTGGSQQKKSVHKFAKRHTVKQKHRTSIGQVGTRRFLSRY